MTDLPLIPLACSNERVYCPRLAYLMWMQGEFQPDDYTVDIIIKRNLVNRRGGTLPEQPEVKSRGATKCNSVSIDEQGLQADIDLSGPFAEIGFNF